MKWINVYNLLCYIQTYSFVHIFIFYLGAICFRCLQAEGSAATASSQILATCVSCGDSPTESLEKPEGTDQLPLPLLYHTSQIPNRDEKDPQWNTPHNSHGCFNLINFFNLKKFIKLSSRKMLVNCIESLKKLE